MSGDVGAEVAAVHSVAGAVDPPQGAGQTIPELHILCLNCGWMSASDYSAHLAPLIAERVEAAKAEVVAAFEAYCVHCAGPCLHPEARP